MKKVVVEIPDREADEPPSTEEQITVLKGISPTTDTAHLRSVGRYQLAAMIQRLRDGEFKKAPREKLPPPSLGSQVVALIIFGVLLLLYVVKCGG